MKNTLWLIKFGGSVITDKSKEFTARDEAIVRLGKELRDYLKDGKTKVILVHGSGSFGHRPAAKYETAKGIVNAESVKGFPIVADAAIQINRIVIKNLLKIGIPGVSLSPLSMIKAKKGLLNQIFLEPIKRILNLNLVPVLYGDVIMDEENGFCIFSAEKTIAALATNLRNDFEEIRIIYCGDTDGVYDSDGKTIDLINEENFNEIKRMVTGSSQIDVTGGMLHKIEESLQLAKTQKIETLIINGNREGQLLLALSGQTTDGTKIN